MAAPQSGRIVHPITRGRIRVSPDSHFRDHQFGNGALEEALLSRASPVQAAPETTAEKNIKVIADEAICSAERFCSRAPKPLVDSAEVPAFVEESVRWTLYSPPFSPPSLLPLAVRILSDIRFSSDCYPRIHSRKALCGIGDWWPCESES